MASFERRKGGGSVSGPAGLALLAVPLVWRFFYSSQYDGAATLLELKAPCVAVTAEDCVSMQKRLFGSRIPRDHPQCRRATRGLPLGFAW